MCRGDKRVRQQAFPARLVNGRPIGVGEDHAEAGAARGYCSS
jgi:hypothetical protein